MIYILIYCLKGTLPWKGILTLDFLKEENSKEKILEWRNSHGELCKDIERIPFLFCYNKFIAEFAELLEYA